MGLKICAASGCLKISHPTSTSTKVMAMLTKMAAVIKSIRVTTGCKLAQLVVLLLEVQSMPTDTTRTTTLITSILGLFAVSMKLPLTTTIPLHTYSLRLESVLKTCRQLDRTLKAASKPLSSSNQSGMEVSLSLHLALSCLEKSL